MHLGPRAENNKSALVLIGPLGVGHHLCVPRSPLEDEGGRCERYQRTCVWDAAIVACELGMTWRTVLVGNYVGGGADADELRLHLRNHGVLLDELPASWKGPSFDVVISKMDTGSRTWYSTIHPPDLQKIFSSVNELVDRFAPEIVYFDHWFDNQTPQELANGLRSLGAHRVYYNAGDTSSLEHLTAVLEALSSRYSIVQVSWKGGRIKSTEHLRRVAQKLAPRKQQAVILTQGANNAYMFSRDVYFEVPVKSLRNVVTVGAGAYLSAYLIDHLRDAGWPSLTGICALLQEGCHYVTLALKEEAFVAHLLFSSE